MLSLVAIIEGLISSAPEAVELWNKISGLVAPTADVPADQVAAINALVPVAHAAVDTLHAALDQVVASHGVTPTT